MSVVLCKRGAEPLAEHVCDAFGIRWRAIISHGGCIHSWRATMGEPNAEQRNIAQCGLNSKCVRE